MRLRKRKRLRISILSWRCTSVLRWWRWACIRRLRCVRACMHSMRWTRWCGRRHAWRRVCPIAGLHVMRRACKPCSELSIWCRHGRPVWALHGRHMLRRRRPRRRRGHGMLRCIALRHKDPAATRRALLWWRVCGCCRWQGGLRRRRAACHSATLADVTCCLPW